MSIATKVIICLILLGIVDAVIPLPVIGIILILIVFTKPAWFRDAVLKIYNGSVGD